MKVMEALPKALFGHDIFFSYSRQDGLDYAYRLAEKFIENGYDCFIDQLMSSTPGEKIPPGIIRALKRSTALVIVGTKGAGNSMAIQQEIENFLSLKSNNPIIVIDIDGAVPEAAWYPMIKGLPIIAESKTDFLTSKPSDNIISRITNSLTFNKKSKKLRRASYIVAIATLLMTAVLTVQGISANKLKEEIAGKQHMLDTTLKSLDSTKASLQTAISQATEAGKELKVLGALRDALEIEKDVLSNRNTSLSENIAMVSKDLNSKRAELQTARKEYDAIQMANEAVALSASNPTKAVQMALNSYAIQQNNPAASVLVKHFNDGSLFYSHSFENIRDMSFSKAGDILYVDSSNHQLFLYHPQRQEARRIGLANECGKAMFIEDDSLIFAMGDPSCKIYDLSGNLKMTFVTGQLRYNSHLRYFKDQHVVVCSNGPEIFMMDLYANEMKQLHLPSQHAGNDFFVSHILPMESNSGFLIMGNARVAYKWNFDGEYQGTMPAENFVNNEGEGKYYELFPLLNNRYIIGASKDTVTIFDSKTLNVLLRFIDKQAVSVSPSGRYFAVGKYFAPTGIYDAEKLLGNLTGYSPLYLEGEYSSPFGVSFSPDDRYVTIAKTSDEMSIYNLRGDYLAKCKANFLDAQYVVASDKVIWNKSSTGFVSFGKTDPTSYYWDMSTARKNIFYDIPKEYSNMLSLNEKETLIAMSIAHTDSFHLIIADVSGNILCSFDLKGVLYDSHLASMNFSTDDSYFRWILKRNEELDTLYFDLKKGQVVQLPVGAIFKGHSNDIHWAVDPSRSSEGTVQLFIKGKQQEALVLTSRQRSLRNFNDNIEVGNNVLVLKGSRSPEIFLVNTTAVVERLKQLQMFKDN